MMKDVERRWTIIGLGGVIAACGADPTGAGAPSAEKPDEPRINNGQHAQTCQWPSTVALLNGSPFCSGTLIHPRFVLTAAHCIASQFPSQIGFGEDGFAPQRTVSVQDCVMHPEYDQGLDIDLALCELSEPVTDVQTVPILLGCEQEVLETPAPHIEIAGYGNTQTTFLDWEWYEGFGVGPKRYVTQQIFEIRQAQQEIDLEGVGVLSGGCHGDSGGGAFVQLADGSWRVFAVAQSWNNVPGDPYDDTGGASDGPPSSTGDVPSATTTGASATTTGANATTTGAGSDTDGPVTDDGAGFIDPTDDGVAFIDPTDDGVTFVDPDDEGGDGFVDVCGWGTTYSLIAPQMQWIEDVIGEDTSACFTADGAWDPNTACTPFPMQLDQSVGSWANGCAGALGGEPQCGELDPVAGSSDDGGSTEDTGTLDGGTDAGGVESTGGDDNADESEAGDGTTPPQTDGPAPSDDTAGGTGEDAGSSATGDDSGCGCRQSDGDRGPAWLGAFGLIALARRRRRGRPRLAR